MSTIPSLDDTKILFVASSEMVQAPHSGLQSHEELVINNIPMCCDDESKLPETKIDIERKAEITASPGLALLAFTYEDEDGLSGSELETSEPSTIKKSGNEEVSEVNKDPGSQSLLILKLNIENDKNNLTEPEEAGGELSKELLTSQIDEKLPVQEPIATNSPDCHNAINTITEKMDKKDYNSSEFASDMRSILANCCDFTNPNDEMVIMAKKMEKAFEQRLATAPLASDNSPAPKDNEEINFSGDDSSDDGGAYNNAKSSCSESDSSGKEKDKEIEIIQMRLQQIKSEIDSLIEMDRKKLSKLKTDNRTKKRKARTNSDAAKDKKRKKRDK